MTLPIFPLNVVALPSQTVPLMIFEARYRVLFSTLLHGEEGVDEGLVQKDSPFAGTKRFGMCFVDKEGRLASVGTTLEIMEFMHVP
ncbi:Lon N-terminal domain-containing protein, partial [Haematococcus lacustris]